MKLDYKHPQPIIPGKLYRGLMPHSEVCIHMQVAGKVMEFELLPRGAVQLYKDRQLFSSPILSGEAGIYQNDDGSRYYYPPIMEEQVHG